MTLNSSRPAAWQTRPVKRGSSSTAKRGVFQRRQDRKETSELNRSVAETQRGSADAQRHPALDPEFFSLRLRDSAVGSSRRLVRTSRCLGLTDRLRWDSLAD